MERRFLPVDECAVSIETRADAEPKIVGRAAVFYDGTEETEYKLFDAIVAEDGRTISPALVERISERAFNKALSEKHDVRALFNHDPNLVLGRTKSGTLKLTKSLRGLDYEVKPGDTTVARDVAEHIKRGDVTGSSFGFIVRDQKFSHDKERGVDIREIRSLDLTDVSCVTYPAYSATSVSMRDEGMEEVRSAHGAWRQEVDEQRKAAIAADEAKTALEAKLAAVAKRAQEVEA